MNFKIHLFFLGAGGTFWGSFLLSGAEPRWLSGTFIHFFSLFLLWFSFPKISAHPQENSTQPFPANTKFLTKNFSTCVLVTAALLLGAQLCFLKNLWWFGVFLFITAVLFLIVFRIPWLFPSAPRKENFFEKACFLLIFFTALLLRFLFLSYPFTGLQIDEANSLEGAWRMAQGKDWSPFRTIWMGNPSFTHAFTALAFRLFGPSVEAGRMVSAVVSLAAVVFFYKWCRLSSSPPPALFSAFLFTFSAWHLYFARSPFHNIFTLFFAVCACFFIQSALATGKRSDAFFSGMACAGAVMSYISGRLVPLILAATWLTGWVLQSPSLKKSWKIALAQLSGFLWLISPFLWFIKEIPSEFFSRTQQLNLLADIQKTGDWTPLGMRLQDTLQALFGTAPHAVDPRFQVPHVPLLEIPLGIFGAAGFFLALFHFRKFENRLMVFGISAGLCANVLARDPFLPHTVNALRFFILFPFAAYAAAYYLNIFFRGLQNTSRRARYCGFLALGGLSLGAWCQHFETYFHRFQETPVCWRLQSHDLLAVARDLLSLPQNTTATAHWTFFQSPCSFLIKNAISYRKLETLRFPLPENGDRKIALYLWENEYQKWISDLRKIYPRFKERTAKDPWGRILFRVIEIPPENIPKSTDH